MSVKEKIIDIIKNATDIENIEMDSNLMDDLELSSLEIFTMFSDIEDEFGIKIPTDEIETISSIEDIVRIVEEKVG
ncbi:MAG: phosphopantetheine-binding protein [Agathobacter sp.]|nr:phosphopantetheine-binding protein [Agathobacter sp.]